MWLIKTGPWAPGTPSSLELHQRESDQEPYAILSHTWGQLKDEVLFEDVVTYCDQTVRQNEGYILVDYRQGPGAVLRNKKGWLKIDASIKQARADGFGWVWIDTCCINKQSSAELSEAINSMYVWYEASAVCYAYIADVSSQDPDEFRRASFYQSRWFTRGWTLQELIAPKTVVFFSQEWSPLGNKRSLAVPLTAITKIDEGVLRGTRTLESMSIAQRMSWAASRQTKRPEDQAYSLMGLFGVNMPMLYGEGEKAFQRLQQEIMKLSDDQSIFCWTDPDIPATVQHGMLADSPKAFAHASNYRGYSAFEEMKPYDMCNRGLRINIPLTPTDEPDVFVGALHCSVPPANDGYLGIYLQKLPEGEFQYARIRCGILASLSSRGQKQDVFVLRPLFPRQDEWTGVLPAHYLVFRNVGSTNREFSYSLKSTVGPVPKAEDETLRHWVVSTHGRQHIQTEETTVFKFVKARQRLSAVLLIQRQDGEMIQVLLGALTDFEPGFDVRERDPSSASTIPAPAGRRVQPRAHWELHWED